MKFREMVVAIQHLYVQTGLIDYAIKMLKKQKWNALLPESMTDPFPY
jgi:hypothetical protein